MPAPRPTRVLCLECFEIRPADDFTKYISLRNPQMIAIYRKDKKVDYNDGDVKKYRYEWQDRVAPQDKLFPVSYGHGPCKECKLVSSTSNSKLSEMQTSVSSSPQKEAVKAG